MKTIRFTQSINLSVTVEVTVPEEWNEADLSDYAKEFPTSISVGVSPEFHDDLVTVDGVSMDHAETTDAQVW